METGNPERPEFRRLPLLPLRDVVVYPHMVLPLFVGRAKSIRALEDAMAGDKQVLLVAQRNASDDEPTPEDIHSVGTIATVLQMLKLPDGTVKVLVEGVSRATVKQLMMDGTSISANVEELEDVQPEPMEAEALSKSLLSQFDDYVKMSKKVAPEIVSSVTSIDELGRLADAIAAHLQ